MTGDPKVKQSEFLNEADFIELQSLYASVSPTGYKPSLEDFVGYFQMLIDTVDALLDLDTIYRTRNDIKAEKNQYKFLAGPNDDLPIQDRLMLNYMFVRWVKRSPNLFAEAYRLGAEHKVIVTKKSNVKRAVTGRRLIGAASRAKVAKSAEPFRHLSKSDASFEIASLINLDAGTIKRYLSELFPGDKWKP